MLGVLDKPLVRIPVYAGFGLLVFFIAVAATFPDDQIKDIITVEIEKQLEGKYSVDIGDLDVWWLTGVSLKNVTIEERVDPSELTPQSEEEAEAEAGLPGGGPMKLTIPRMSGRLAIFRTIVGGPTINFEVELGGGTIDGSFQQGSDARRVVVDIDGLDLRKTTELTAFLGVPFFGDLKGNIDLQMHPTRPAVTAGTIKLRGDRLTVGPATIKTDKFPPITYLEIPQTNFGTLDIELGVGGDEAEGGDESDEPSSKAKGEKSEAMKIETFEWAGRDIRGEMWGEFDLASRIDRMQADVEMRMQLDENFVKKNSLGPLLNVSEVRKGKNRDWFGFRLYGRVKNIRFKGAPKSAAGPAAKAAAEAEEDDDDDDSP